MKTITDEDGNVYVLKTDMEAAIKERISKVTSRAQEAFDTGDILDGITPLTEEEAIGAGYLLGDICRAPADRKSVV